MKRKEFEVERKKVAADLRQLASILTQKRVCADISPLSSAADQCSAPVSSNFCEWGYDISNLVFRLDPIKGTMPAKTKNLRAELSISVVGRFNGAAEDQFVNLAIDLEKYALSADGAELKAAWHFDRHIIDTANDDPHGSNDVHPLYHFQFGGAKLAGIGEELGRTFALDPPRLMHPPMDGIIAIDFVLANYAGPVWKMLRDDPHYKKLVAPHFEKIWHPFFSAIAGSFGRNRLAYSNFLCPFLWN